MTIDIEKIFDSLDHDFISWFYITALKKFGFKSSFMDWVKIFLYQQESCVVNGDVTNQYFRLKISIYISISFYFMLRNSVW